MNPLVIVLIVLGVLLLIFGVLYFLGTKAEKKSASQREAMAAQAQTMSFYVIDKKKVRLSEAGFPKIVLEQTPKLLRRTKVPVLKVKVGPKVMSLICDDKVFPTILPKQEVKASVSGIYVISAKRIRGPIAEAKKTKKELREEKKAAKLAEQEAQKRAEERMNKKAERKEQKAANQAAKALADAQKEEVPQYTVKKPKKKKKK